MNMFVKQVIIKGWKKLVMAITLGTILLGYVQQANAQNIVVDEILRTKYDSLTLDPNTSIKENCAKIINYLVSLYKDAQNEEYMIFLIGHYVGNHQNSYDYPIEMIPFCRRWLNELYFGRLKCMYTNNLESYIEIVLTDLYSKSLDKKFKVNSEEYDSVKVGNGYFYSLNSTSPLYEKIRDKVRNESSLLRRTSLISCKDLLKISKRITKDATNNKKKKEQNDDTYMFSDY